jgi:hypothetical protein
VECVLVFDELPRSGPLWTFGDVINHTEHTSSAVLVQLIVI